MSDETVKMVGLIQNPTSTSTQDGQEATPNLGRQNEQLMSELHGKWYVASYRGAVFSANVTAKTVPVIASGLVSVFGLYNPVGSGKVLELIDFDLGLVLATTVVDTVGLYWQGSPT